MEIITNIKEMQKCADVLRRQERTIVFVPTMGYLHEGKKHGDDVVVSIFVNPTQFGPGEDFEAYPRDFDRDRKLCQSAGADFIFAPDATDIYGKNFQTYIALERLPNHLCGHSRPIHFRGVATVVTKLFHIVKPHVAIFGQKDYQQLLVIRQMVQDLNSDIEIIGAPIVREPDGLAMSSRNTYLTPVQRNSAISLSQSLKRAETLVQSGITDAARIIEAASEIILSQPETMIDYVAVCDPETLEDMKIIDRPALMALAVKIGKTRLIDNMILNSQQIGM